MLDEARKVKGAGKASKKGGKNGGERGGGGLTPHVKWNCKDVLVARPPPTVNRVCRLDGASAAQSAAARWVRGADSPSLSLARLRGEFVEVGRSPPGCTALSRVHVAGICLGCRFHTAASCIGIREEEAVGILSK